MSWETVKIKSISKQIRGISYTPKDVSNIPLDNHIRLLRANNITESGIDLTDTTFVNKKCISEVQKLKIGDILIAASSGSIKIVGKAILIEYEINSSFGAFCKVIRPNENVDYRYLSYYFRTSEYRQKISNLAAGANINNLRNEDLDNLEIPLPPLPIQKRIAEILDAVDALKHKDQELLKKYDELAQAIFIDMFGDPVKNEKGFIMKRIGDCIDNIQIGPFGTQLHESDYIKNGIPVINPMHIGKLKIQPNCNYSIPEEKYLELPQYHLKTNDVILARRGEMGRCAIVPEQLERCLCGTGSLYITVNKGILEPLFLVYVLSRRSTKVALENISAGTTMANLNKTIINDFRIIVPDIQSQREFVKAIKISEQSIDLTNKLIERSAGIFNSLIQKAFNGELVT